MVASAYSETFPIATELDTDSSTDTQATPSVHLKEQLHPIKYGLVSDRSMLAIQAVLSLPITDSIRGAVFRQLEVS